MGLPLPEVDSDIVDRLEEEIGELETTKNLFVGPLRPVSDVVPVDAVFVLSTGGAPPDRTFSPGRVEIRYPSVQIRVRAERKRHGMELLANIYSALQSMPFGVYRDVRTETSDPTWIEIADDEFYHWSWNFELFYMGFIFKKKTVKVTSYMQATFSDH